MAKEIQEIKKSSKKKTKVLKQGKKFRKALKSAKKLSYSDMQQLIRTVTEYLEGQKQKQIDDLEQQLKSIKGN